MTENEKTEAPLSEEEKKGTIDVANEIRLFARMAVIASPHPLASLTLAAGKILEDMITGVLINQSAPEEEIRGMLQDIIDTSIQAGVKKAQAIRESGLVDKALQMFKEMKDTAIAQALMNVPENKIGKA